MSKVLSIKELDDMATNLKNHENTMILCQTMTTKNSNERKNKLVEGIRKVLISSKLKEF